VQHGIEPARLSNTMDVEFCNEAVDEAMARYGRPDIFNTVSVA